MAYPHFMYGDPMDVVEADQIQAIKHRHGCAACLGRDKTIKVFEKRLCAQGKAPGPLGFCTHWQFDEGVSCGDSAD